MPTLSPLKKTLIASAFITPLVLGACSSETEEDTEAQNAAAAAATNESAAKQGGSGSGEEADAEANGEDTEEGADQAAAAAEGDDADAATDTADGNQIDPAADPLDMDQLTFAELAPVEGGQPADEGVQAEIESLVNGVYDASTLHEILLYVPENTCHQVIQENGGEAVFDLGGIPDVSLDQVPQYSQSNSRIDAVEDVQVSGETASATVTATSDGQSLTETQRFRLEDGTWKFCN